MAGESYRILRAGSGADALELLGQMHTRGDRHRGSLTLDSEPGRTVFRVRLPVEQSAG